MSRTSRINELRFGSRTLPRKKRMFSGDIRDLRPSDKNIYTIDMLPWLPNVLSTGGGEIPPRGSAPRCGSERSGYSLYENPYEICLGITTADAVTPSRFCSLSSLVPGP